MDSPPTGGPAGARVLLVEDDPDLHAFIAQALSTRYRVASALDAQAGLDEADRTPPPDLVLLGTARPGVRGEDMLARLRGNPRLHDVPVLMLTQGRDDALAARLLRQGAQGFLHKPFSREVLLARVARLLADRRRALEQLRRSEQRLAAILETARDAIIVTDDAQRIVLFNEAAQRMFGYAAEAVVGENIQLLLPAGCRQACGDPACCDPCTNAPAGAGAQPTRARRADGEEFPAECSTSRLDEDGTFHTVILRDISARVREHQALVLAHEELHRVTEGFERQMLAAVEARQARIARDLHDSVGASLAGVSLLIGAARSAAVQPRVAAALDRAQEQIAATARAVRRVSHGLMPAGTDSGGLLHALEQFAGDLGEAKAVRCTVRSRGAFTGFDAETANHVFRVVQEAVANALRHGHATELRIVLCEGRGRWRACVWDNGSGCVFSGLPRTHPGLGLRSMQARARAIGGRLELGNATGGGCRVRLSWGAPAAPRTCPASSLQPAQHLA
jgi:PAS domain S-box-containing protein